MTNEEKENITAGYTSTTNGEYSIWGTRQIPQSPPNFSYHVVHRVNFVFAACSGTIIGVPRIGFPGLCLSDAGNGVRGTDMTNGYPSGIHVGAAWNRGLAYSRAHYMGAEFKAKGTNVALGPVAGPLGKVARGGRNWEGFSNDPYLSGALVEPTIKGLQESVIACVKHFIGNEQETNRNPQVLVPTSFNASVSGNIDDRTLHEAYLWPFQDAVRAGAGAVMCVYNRLNNSYGCQNSKILNGVLKTELGFQGFVVSDWLAQHTGIASANAGLDMAMPDSPYWSAGNLTQAVANGSVAQSRLDDMATRILASWYKLAPLKDPGHGFAFNLTGPHPIVDARDPAAKPTIFQGAVEGHVLVKNVNNALPLKKPKFLSVFGYDAVAQAVNSKGTGSGFDFWQFGLSNTLAFANGSVFSPSVLSPLFLSSLASNETGPSIALNGTLISGSGSGATTPAYIDAPYDAILRQAYEDDTFLAWDFYSQNPPVNKASEACLVFINELASEGWDRAGLADQYSDELVLNVAAQCSNTIVVLHNAGVRLVDRFIDNPNITAVIYAHLPGQDSGRALVEVMWGKQSPSGRLPYTVAKTESDYGQTLSPAMPSESTPYYSQDNFTEGLYIDYKHFIAQNITPRFEFGYGLTYTTFDYSGLEIELTDASTSLYPPGTQTEGTVPSGGIASLWDVIATVNATITNSGNYKAAEVAQLYVEIPTGPGRVLRGFEKELLAPGASATVTFPLTRRDLSSWDIVSQSWVLQSGSYPVHVGKSVLDIQLHGTLEIVAPA